ncbi:HDOD domain-containing protein [Heliorestis convoluta]|uniref:Stage 0 sporulation protein A homolog n=1 Tax=Heliorestis convoluta TaxID=356322 RepID=A0A5Q2MZ93_9FIRM|nr:HDOD domain-containing protein [Heliorestis convoluta]QGG48294.1 two-component system response regulator [Heliorestis convoluta]
MQGVVLFVDDEVNILQGLKRMLHGMRNQWALHFVSSGQDALSFLASTPVDVIISDLRMPGMDGVALLKMVQHHYPQVVRIILSGQADREQALRSLEVAHQYLGKPCEPKALKNIIQQALMLRDFLKDPHLLRLVTGLKQLPSLPVLYLQLMDEMDSSDPSPKKIGHIISKDMAMTARILQFTNSAFLGLPHPVTNPSHAAVLLGLNTLRALVVTHHIFSTYEEKSDKAAFLSYLWQHSMQVGLLAQRIASDLTGNKKRGEEAW